MPERTIVITGASSGLGRALAMAYAGDGTTLGLIGRDATRLAAVAAACRDRGATVHIGAIDVRDTEALVAWLQAFDSRGTVDLLIANAGIVSGRLAAGSPEPLGAALEAIDVNLKGAIATASSLADRMEARRSGHIALVSSLAGLAPQPDLPAYSASKAALVSYGTALRIRLRPHGVAVSIVCPGYVATPMSDRQRAAKPFIWPAPKAARHIRRRLDRRDRLIAFPWPLALGIRMLALAPPGLRERVLGRFRAEIAHDDAGREDENTDR